MGIPATHFAGIDIGKDALDAAMLGPGGRTRGKRFGNDSAGHAAFLAWASRLFSVASPARVKADMKAFYVRLTDPAGGSGPKMRAVGACMRKRVMMCYGVLENRTPFDPNYPGVHPDSVSGLPS